MAPPDLSPLEIEPTQAIQVPSPQAPPCSLHMPMPADEHPGPLKMLGLRQLSHCQMAKWSQLRHICRMDMGSGM
ncbi:hypothetical protein BDV24DRAFT_169308 [Aspergillus arachidicola]|uniref:Uncharacterized protein n=1 Tax=Aspergillus arachidicola TaxID=656916 RepID=A0A5N6XQ77_9EURO|nr:hypothetical protein BDV24DRAFT_169308 [Aspergillus arachidicola]